MYDFPFRLNNKSNDHNFCFPCLFCSELTVGIDLQLLSKYIRINKREIGFWNTLIYVEHHSIDCRVSCSKINIYNCISSCGVSDRSAKVHLHSMWCLDWRSRWLWVHMAGAKPATLCLFIEKIIRWIHREKKQNKTLVTVLYIIVKYEAHPIQLQQCE